VLDTYTHADRQMWVLLVHEATQLSDSWVRMQKFHEALLQSDSKLQYQKAMERIENETMAIPVEWVRQTKGAAAGARLPSLKQAEKDLQRDGVAVDGRLLTRPSTDELATEVAWRILERRAERLGRKLTPEEESLATMTAIVLARDVVLASTRTLGGGDMFEAVHLLFQRDDLVNCAPFINAGAPDPVTVSVTKRAKTEVSPTTGMPEFQGDKSSARFSIEKVRAMNKEMTSPMKITAVQRDAWVRDDEVLNCMRCGVRFHALVRRHHCRACGALVCGFCSQHSISISYSSEERRESGMPPLSENARVCFLCYQKVVYEDLQKRKESGDFQQVVAANLGLSSDASGGVPPASPVSHSPASQADAAAGGPNGPNYQRVASDSDESSEPHQTAEAADLASEEEVDWPLISIEMSATYRIVDANPTNEDTSTWFSLDCRYVRVVRWSGLADEGRVFISVVPPAAE